VTGLNLIYLRNTVQICQQIKILVLCCIISRMVALLKFTVFPKQVSSFLFLLLVSNSIYLRYKHSSLTMTYYISVCCALFFSTFIYICWNVKISVSRVQEEKQNSTALMRASMACGHLSLMKLQFILFCINEGKEQSELQVFILNCICIILFLTVNKDTP